MLEDLRVLELGGQGSQSIPNGLPESTNSQQRPFQGYYDAKYWTKDQPPPARPAPTPMPSGGGSENRLGVQQQYANTGWSSSSLPMSGPARGVSPGARDREKKKKGFLGF
jgi:syntaxin-binding protein 1